MQGWAGWSHLFIYQIKFFFCGGLVLMSAVLFSLLCRKDKCLQWQEKQFKLPSAIKKKNVKKTLQISETAQAGFSDWYILNNKHYMYAFPEDFLSVSTAVESLATNDTWSWRSSLYRGCFQTLQTSGADRDIFMMSGSKKLNVKGNQVNYRCV